MSTERRWHYHDDAERRQWQDPEAVLADIGLPSGATFIDIGCGQGFFAIPAARIVGENGKVYALDSNGEAISRLREKAAGAGLGNLEARVATAEEAVLCRACADIVFFGIVLHDFSDPAKVIANAREMLKSGGRLANVDWKKQPMPFGPPLSKRFSEEQATRLIESAGFKVTAVRDSGLYHYIIIASPG